MLRINLIDRQTCSTCYFAAREKISNVNYFGKHMQADGIHHVIRQRLNKNEKKHHIVIAKSE